MELDRENLHNRNHFPFFSFYKIGKSEEIADRETLHSHVVNTHLLSGTIPGSSCVRFSHPHFSSTSFFAGVPVLFRAPSCLPPHFPLSLVPPVGPKPSTVCT